MALSTFGVSHQDALLHMIEQGASQSILWLIPIIEELDWSTNVERFEFRGLSEGGEVRALLALSHKNRYAVLLGAWNERLKEALAVVRQAGSAMIFTEPSLVDVMNHEGTLEQKCPRIIRRLVYRLDPGELRLFPDIPVRLAREEDIETLDAWYHAFFGAEEKSPLPQVPSYRSYIFSGNTYVYEKEGRLLSVTRVPFAGSRFAKLAGSYTPPELRGKGYGTSLQGAVCSQLLARNLSVLSDVEDHNGPSIAVKHTLGFRKVGAEVDLFPDWNRW